MQGEGWLVDNSWIQRRSSGLRLRWVCGAQPSNAHAEMWMWFLVLLVSESLPQAALYFSLKFEVFVGNAISVTINSVAHTKSRTHQNSVVTKFSVGHTNCCNIAQIFGTENSVAHTICSDYCREYRPELKWSVNLTLQRVSWTESIRYRQILLQKNIIVPVTYSVRELT